MVLLSLKKRVLKNWLPSVRFQISSLLKGNNYYEFLLKFLDDFLKDEEHKQLFLPDEQATEGGIGAFKINGQYIFHEKLYWLDFNYHGGQKGLLFRNHEDMIEHTSNVYLIADAFEQFLGQRDINFRRYGLSAKRKAILQSKSHAK